MDYPQRLAEATALYNEGLRRVAETPPPEGQKYAPGTRVKIANDLGESMSHFPAGKLATVQCTYAHAYQCTDANSLRQYRLDVDGEGNVSWYDEAQLTPVNR